MSTRTQRDGAPAQRPVSERSSGRQEAAEHPERTARGRLDDPELLAEVGRLTEPVITAARRQRGRIFGVATEEWWHADDAAKLAGVLIVALAWLVNDPERMVRERLRRMSWDLSAAHDWAAASRRPSHAEFQRRRGDAA